MMRKGSGLSHQSFSRAARVVVLLSMIGIVLIAAWVFAPILLAKNTSTVAAAPPPRAVVAQPTITLPIAAAPKATAAAIVEPAPPVRAPASVTASVPPVAATVALATRWSNDLAAPALAIMQPSESVPLPRKRPSLTAAARLATPLPRPRPEIDGEVSSDEISALELQVQRQR
jgi:hypothetical protein